MLHSQYINVSVYPLVFLKLKKRGDFSKGPIINALEIYTYIPITAGKQSPFPVEYILHHIKKYWIMKQKTAGYIRL
jgi:hypothetical protein